MKKIHIISHTHWDREWYLQSKYTNEWLIEFFDGLFAMLEREPEYQFVLDGQTMLLEDYYVELRKKGMSVAERKAQLQRGVRAGKIFMGPLYNQPDWQLVSEESLVKNLILGNKISKEYGKRMNIAWLLDNFGQISQTAQILKNADLTAVYVWRGVEMNPNNVHSEFYWQAADGTKLPAIYLLDSYRNGMRLAEYRDIFETRIKDIYSRLKPFARTDNMLVLNGYDQEIVPDDVLSLIADGKKDSSEYQLLQSNPEQYIEAVLAEKPELQILKGALYSGRFISVFPGVLSSRMYLKQQNDHSEKLVEKIVEPLALINWLTGGEYNERHIDAAYKKLLMNQPHDSICGCSIDDVHKDMETRTDLVNTLFNDEIDATLGELVAKIDTTDSLAMIIFNTSPYTRDIVLEHEGEVFAVKDVAACGFKVIKEAETLADKLFTDKKTMSVENATIKVRINSNGSFDLFDKLNGKNYTQLGLLEDKADSGDEYNYSYPNIDKIFSSSNINADINFMTVNAQLVKIKVSFDLLIPIGLNKKREERLAQTIAMPVTSYITIKAGTSVVSFETEILNTAKDHIVSVLFPTQLNTNTSQAGAQFDVVTRDISYQDFDESEIPKHVKEVIIGAREPKPNKIFPHREFVDLSDGRIGLAVLNKGLPEFTVVEENRAIKLTLFRAVAWVADKINSRLGDAGPKMLTPDAQCLRQMKFHYAVYPHAGNYEEGNVVRVADLYNSDPVLVKTTVHEGALKSGVSFLKVVDPCVNVKTTALKRSLDKKALTLRLYNSSEAATVVELASVLPINKITETQFLEEVETEVDSTILVAPKQIMTLKVYLERQNYEGGCVAVNRLDHVFKEDYAGYAITEYVKEEDILAELKRAESLQDYVDTPALGRSALEAQLSAILTRIRKDETKIKELGYKLNNARVVRRLWDYIKKYHQD